MSDHTRVEASSGLSVSTPTCTVLYGLLRKVQERHTITKARHTLHSLDTPFHAHLRLEHPHKTPFQILGFEELSAVSASQAGRDWCGLCRTGSHIEVSKSPNGTGSQFDRIKRPFKNLVSFCRIVTTFSAKMVAAQRCQAKTNTNLARQRSPTARSFVTQRASPLLSHRYVHDLGSQTFAHKPARRAS